MKSPSDAKLHAYPLLLQPVYKDYIWGGDRIGKQYNRSISVTPCAESWEISDRQDGMTVITNETYRGLTLHELVQCYGTQITGTAHSPDRFPLLIKLIDAKAVLSVQVHPHDTNAALTGGEAKTEMWLTLDHDPGAQIYAGLQPGTMQEEFLAALDAGKMESVLAPVPAQAGQVVFIPGGRVHAIGAGCLLLEVQQNSNTTYRVYDWGRTDAEGRARETHLEKALQVIDWAHCAPEVYPSPSVRKVGKTDLFSAPYFTISRLVIEGGYEWMMEPTSFTACFVERGSVRITGNGISVIRKAGDSCLLPAALPRAEFESLAGSADIIMITGQTA